jgi:copper chaperone NosL
MGGMGPALHPFSDEAEANSFAENYGGTTYGFDDINQALVESLQESGGM